MDSESLLGLARSRAPADRERLLLGVVDLCAAGQAAASAATAPPVQALLSSIFMSLVVEAERDIRQRLAEKLATAEWAPPTLINVLALDEIEIARPIIAASPLLQDADLIRLLIEATIEHLVALLDTIDGDPDLEDGGDAEPEPLEPHLADAASDLEYDPAQMGEPDDGL